VHACLEAGKPARDAAISLEEKNLIKSLMLLSMKPVIYAANVADSDLATGNEMSKAVADLASKQGASSVIVSAQVLNRNSHNFCISYIYLRCLL
jgi:ribosome-binding ATPase YchF (GTP1/OBG family)